MMPSLWNVCWAESLKLRRSRAPLMSVAAYAMVPLAAAILLLAGNEAMPGGLSARLSLESQISLVHADWPGYFSVLASAGAVGGLAVFGLFMIWIFGREHADRTSKELLTLPIAREALVAGKILVAALWCALLQLGMLAAALLIGALLKLPLSSGEALREGLGLNLRVAGLTFCLVLPFGLLANLSRGMMAAVGALFLSLFFALIFTALGWGAYFPWAIPALYAGAGGELAGVMGALSFCLVIFTGLAGAACNMIWWRWADQR